ncbi:MAG TPA: response regulator transcription factor [Streptosporangiaceae bacterium]|nr:response regulator transcription factor [Streptosporangiaceae bacterium]
MNTIAAVIIDQERTFADALAMRLNAEDDIQVVTVAHPSAAQPGWHADVIVLDGDLPDSLARCTAASRRPDAARVIMVSKTSQPSRILAAVEAGARAWVRKDESVEHLLCVLRGVARGETWLPPAETGNVLALLLRQRDRRRGGEGKLAMLTPRERQVLACLAAGDPRNRVAERLNLAPNTVRTHLQNIMAKLGVHSALEAVALARDRLER